MWILCQLFALGYALLVIILTFALWRRKNDIVHECHLIVTIMFLLNEQMETTFQKGTGE